MAQKIKWTARTIAALLAVCICASAQQDAGLVYSARAKRAGYPVKLTSGLVDTQGTLYLEPGQVAIRNKSGTDIVIADHELLDAVDLPHRRGMPYIRLSAIQGCDDGREAVLFLTTAVAWDAVAGIASLFRRTRHFVTINYSRDGQTQSETLQLSGKDAQKLVKELQLRRGIAFVPGEQ